MKNNFNLSLLAVAASTALFGCNSSSTNTTDKPSSVFQVAFMSDVHFHDVYAEFDTNSGDAFEGIPTSNGKNATIRTMAAQLGSTRLFNENYFAFRAALDDLAERGVKLIALPGDYSDDGQPVNLRGMNAMMNEYREKYGMEFFVAPGNHDPARAFDREAGKGDYLSLDYKDQPIHSLGDGSCSGDVAANQICNDDAIFLGKTNLMDFMSDSGFMPKQEYLYYETPFSTAEAKGDHYTFDKAEQEAVFSMRMYEMCAEGTGGEYKQAGYDESSCVPVQDSSYLVEPVPGLWLLSIDAVVTPPKAGAASDPTNNDYYDGPQNQGADFLLSHKENVVDWITDVVSRANAQGKKLVAFSHYPMEDFYGGASRTAEALYADYEGGEVSLGNMFQTGRVPSEGTGAKLADTGLQIHVGGHMHYNSTTVTESNDGSNHLINIQAPSVAAYVPAYKLMTLNESDVVKVETVVLEDVRGYNELFEHYEQEYQVAETFKNGTPWDYRILDARSYVEMNDYHIQGLTKFNWLGNWPGVASPVLQNISGAEMLILSQLETDITLCELSQIIDLPGDHDECITSYGLSDQWMKDWNTATIKAQQFASDNGQNLSDYTWSGLDMATDFYRLRNADELAIEYGHTFKGFIPQYALVSKALSEMQVNIMDENGDEHPVGDAFKKEFGIIFTATEMLYNRAPSNNFLINRATGEVSDMTGTFYRAE